MKNIHVLPTDKPSRLYKKLGRELKYSIEYFEQNGLLCINQNIYITSDEEIEEGFVFNTFNNTVYKIVPNNSSREMLANPFILPLCAINKEHYFKLILTTDKDLIKNGVQAIDDDFLEWFVKNPSSEEVEVEKYFHEVGDNYDYEIIIPKEEPKTKCYCGHTTYCDCGSLEDNQETLEYNKLCAEFLDMEFEIHSNTWRYKDLITTELLFHSDWNWIMEVKRHIVGLGYCWFQFPDIIQINENATISSFKIIKIEFNKLKEKEAVVEAINQFLIWYKQQ
jgi:hypothetical protein